MWQQNGERPPMHHPHATPDRENDSSMFTWGKHTLKKLIEAEARLFASVGVHVVSRFVPIRMQYSEMYTVTYEPKEKQFDDPVVLMHGFGAGVAIWSGNIAKMSQHRTVHAFDLLGFGRSSRPWFSGDATLAELQMVESIEDWRKSMGIEKMFLVGHSFGAYLASSYALEHPNRVRHLVLVDPWGFPDQPSEQERKSNQHRQVTPYPWMIYIGGVLSYFNPLAILRVAGPYGATFVKKLRPDLRQRYPSENPDDIYDYIHCVNNQKPTGESAFKNMTSPFGWARRPMCRRFHGLDDNVPVTFIYGSRSWIDNAPAFDIQSQRVERTGKRNIEVQVISGAGHHVYADKTDAFNDIIHNIVDH